MASTAILAAAGLVTSPNQLNTQEGSLSEANNVVIRRDGIIEQRRGMSNYGEALPSPSQRVKQITSYRQRILRHYSNKLQFDSNGSGRFVDISGLVTETETGLRLKFVESNGNLYFTTKDGVKKLSAANANELALMSIENSGIDRALDTKAIVKIIDNLQTGFLPQDSKVAYRVVWNKEDRNNNLITGAPSQPAIVSFPMSELIVRDTMRLLQVLDELENFESSTTRIDDRNYLNGLKLDLSSSPSQIRSNLIALANKLDNDIILAKQSITNPAPVRIVSAEIKNKIATITFEKVEAATLTNLNTLANKNSYTIYKTTTDNKLYYYNGTTFIERETLKDYFSSGLDINLSGFSLSTRFEIQTINFTTIPASTAPDAGNLTIKYKGNESDPIPFNASNSNIQSIISKVGGLELISSVTGSWTTGFTLTFDHTAGDLDQITVGPSTNLSVGSNFVIVSTDTTQDGIAKTEGDLNGKQTVSVVSENTITFNTEAIGVVSVNIGAEIKYNEFRSIPEPTDPSIPALNSDLTSLQLYLDTILQILQNLPDTIISEYEEQEYASYFNFPTVNQSTNIIYKALDTNKTYLWRGQYIEGTDDKQKLEKINLTTTANVELTFTIPESITTNDFYQIYRSSITQATDSSKLEDLFASDEMKLIFEAYPTESEILSKKITILDETPEIFRGANLYTNASTGEGILQSNYPAPFAKDINRYRNSVFYANTRTKHKLQLSILALENLIQNYTENNKPKLTITNGTVTNTYTFVTDKKESVKINVTNTNILDKSFKLFSARGNSYRIYFNTLPTLDENEIPIKITLNGTLTQSKIAIAISDKISTLLDDFSTYYTTTDENVVVITNVIAGEVELASPGDTGFIITQLENGRSANSENLEILLSTNVSIAQAVDETAKSLIEIVNKNLNESVYAFYMSGIEDVPGKISFESRSLEDFDPFYISTNNEILGKSFNPDISPDFLITNINTVSTKTTITTNKDHGLITGNEVIISGSNSVPSVDGIYIINKISNNQFTITKEISSPGNTGSGIKKMSALVSENEMKMNRVYYSKFNEPEAVPIVNYFDLGASDKKIIRILPLRDSLFVFKEDGLFRISGESAPFQSELFDNSFILLAPDSLDVCNNVIYGWTTQGVQALTEGGASVISRNIDNIILKTQSNNYLNFKTATWGIGYESDNSYLIFTVKELEDEVAEIAYRFSTLTNTWTTYDKSYSCGHIADFDDHFYAAPTDIAYIEKERKSFSRFDYCDREYTTIINESKISGNKVLVPIVSDFEIGDVFAQDQTINQYEFNQLLRKLDADSGPSFNNYFDELAIITTSEALKNQTLTVNINPRSSLVALANKLDSDDNITNTNFFNLIDTKSGTIKLIEIGDEAIIECDNEHGLINGRIIRIFGTNSSPNINGIYKIEVVDNFKFKIKSKVTIQGTEGDWQTIDTDFEDLRICYNKIIDLLNADQNLIFSNYREITATTLQEAIIVDIDRIKREITLNLDLPFLAGEAKVFKAIKSSITYSPNTFGDPLNLKHLREATLMFETRTLTSGILSFATDILPEFIRIPFKLDGNGIFGHQVYGEGFFGGLSNSAPFRTYIPRQCQRCRYIVGKFSHSIAREDWRLLGMTITGEVQQSTRAFR